MATILVIDDSSEDRTVIREILAKRNYRVVESANISIDMEGLSKADAVILDPCVAVSTDEHIIEHVRAQRPRLPVIVVSTVGNEEIVINALQQGAVSYVPKTLLKDELLHTVREVLQVAHEHQCIDRLLQRRHRLTCEFVLENERDNLTAVVIHLQQLCAEFGLFVANNDLTRVGMALDEALANAMMHGNLEVSSALRDEEGTRYEDVAKSRAHQSQFASRRIHVSVQLSRSGAEFTIRDEGPGFDPDTIADPTDLGNLERVSGRGVLLMRTFMDEVIFNKKGNCVTLRKFPTPDPQT